MCLPVSAALCSSYSRIHINIMRQRATKVQYVINIRYLFQNDTYSGNQVINSLSASIVIAIRFVSSRATVGARFSLFAEKVAIHEL